jgi:predicted Rossmann fold nucleotide-binding protein DprA/Smf involved in DNA uptake
MPQIPDVRTIGEQIKARIADIEKQLKEHRDLTDELERLRGALDRLQGDVSSRVRTGRRRGGRSTGTQTKPAAGPSPTAKPAGSGRTQRRSVAPRGQTRSKVLESLKDGPKTAGEVAAASGVSRASASTTLNKLTKSGEVVKAERGYKLSG